LELDDDTPGWEIRLRFPSNYGCRRGFNLTEIKIIIRIISMKSTYSIREAQSQLPSLVRQAETGGMATITRHDKAVAYVLGAEDLAALIETMEILADPAARTAIAAAEAGRGRTYSLDEIPE
jgi:prevent-host-death family protein